LGYIPSNKTIRTREEMSNSPISIKSTPPREAEAIVISSDSESDSGETLSTANMRRFGNRNGDLNHRSLNRNARNYRPILYVPAHRHSNIDSLFECSHPDINRELIDSRAVFNWINDLTQRSRYTNNFGEPHGSGLMEDIINTDAPRNSETNVPVVDSTIGVRVGPYPRNPLRLTTRIRNRILHSFQEDTRR
jgi:hypothetical protein